MYAAIINNLWILYPVMLIAAAYLNKVDSKATLLLLIVALSHYLPVKYIENYYLWYAAVISAELLVILLLLKFRVIASFPAVSITVLLLLSHITSHFATNLHLYSVVAKYLEHLQMLTFIVASPLIINKLKRKLRCLM
jgi:hypothetical protein